MWTDFKIILYGTYIHKIWCVAYTLKHSQIINYININKLIQWIMKINGLVITRVASIGIWIDAYIEDIGRVP